VIPVLLVGSNARWREQIESTLAAHGMRVEWWWPTVSQLQASIPAGCGAVIVATDNCSHKLSKPAMERAREAGVPLVCGSHRKSALTPLLTKQGFPPIPTPKEPAMKLSPIPPAASVVHHDAGFETLSEASREVYAAALRLLAADPWMTATVAADVLHVVPATKLWPVLAVVRRTLGIVAAQGSGPARIGNRDRYEAVCNALGIPAVTDDVGPTRPPKAHTPPPPPAAKIPVPAAPAIALPVRVVPPAPALVVVPPPTPEVAPVPAAPPAPPDTSSLPDTVTALRLLLDAMRAEGVERVEVAADGTVAMTRRIVVTATLSL
jgi:hypothetical protein